MVDAAPQSRDARDLAEAARRVVVPAQLRRSGAKVLQPIIFDPEFEMELARAWTTGDAAPDPQLVVHVRATVERVAAAGGSRATIVCIAALRPLVADFLERMGMDVDVFAYTELPSTMRLETGAVIAAPGSRTRPLIAAAI